MKKKKKRQKKKRKKLGNSYYVEIRLQYLTDVKSRCEENTKAGRVSVSVSQPATATTIPLSFVLKSVPESPSGTGLNSYLKNKKTKTKQRNKQKTQKVITLQSIMF